MGKLKESELKDYLAQMKRPADAGLGVRSILTIGNNA
jgi:hypothetical protein